jgi:hypothetical protein
MQPSHNQKISSGRKMIIASLSVTSLIGLANLFSPKDVKSANSEVIDALVNNPLPTLVPVAARNSSVAVPNSTPAAALREVTQVAPAQAPVKQAPLIEVVGGGNSSGSSKPSTGTSSS